MSARKGIPCLRVETWDTQLLPITPGLLGFGDMRFRCGGFDMDAARQLAMHNRRDLFDLVHHARELVGINGLRPVGKRLLWLVVHLDENAVSSDCDCGA